MGKNLKPGQKAARSGEYEIRGPRGGDTGVERTAVRGKPLPPTPKPGESYIARRAAPHHAGALITKSGRTIIVSPAKSANTVSSWSKAFKK